MAFKMKGFSGFKRVDPYADQKAAKQDYYKILMPQLKNQMSKSRYEGLMGELFGKKDGGIGYLLGG